MLASVELRRLEERFGSLALEFVSQPKVGAGEPNSGPLQE